MQQSWKLSLTNRIARHSLHPRTGCTAAKWSWLCTSRLTGSQAPGVVARWTKTERHYHRQHSWKEYRQIKSFKRFENSLITNDSQIGTLRADPASLPPTSHLLVNVVSCQLVLVFEDSQWDQKQLECAWMGSVDSNWFFGRVAWVQESQHVLHQSAVEVLD